MTGNDLTVVIPNFNKADFIEQCVTSIEEQTVKPAHILIIDDASTDDSRSVIEKLSEKYPDIEPVFSEKNTGVSAVRNRGLTLVKTDYVTFIDADDYYYDRYKLENEIKLINTHGDDTIAYSVTAVMRDGSTVPASRLKKSSYYLKGNIRFSLLTMRKWDSVMRDYIVRCDALKNAGGYDENHSLFEDYELLLKLSEKHRFYCTGRFGTAYREGNGISKRRQQDHERIRNEMMEAELQNDGGLYRAAVKSVKAFNTLKRRTKDLLRNKVLKERTGAI